MGSLRYRPVLAAIVAVRDPDGTVLAHNLVSTVKESGEAAAFKLGKPATS